ncbi:hypothetical protein I5M32_01875 [Pedobacter sp. SD-b]|uniref:Tail specific protease domain-containing protein n=1 Tax=Pedobacter segetis TaxID=2793069 RepID=A0ABS1BFQ1_9SPHI|nr:S41 family peptidase [Pedobacter segetis]MBK0381697.1 hypothetical protein [Pedobacter segetis]
MKYAFCLILFSLFSFTGFSQILNPSFEDNLSQWNIKERNHFHFSIDSSQKHIGNQSLKINGRETQSSDYIPFSQPVLISLNHLQTIKISSYVKTENLKGNAALWCQVWDKNNKMIGFQNSEMQNLFINGNTDWQKYSLTITADSSVKKLVLGGYVSGDGTAWFDDLQIVYANKKDSTTSAEVKKFITDFNDIIKKNSIYSDSLNWESINKNIQDLYAGLKTIDEAKVLTSYMIDQLRKAGDNHSFLQTKTVAENYTKDNSTPLKPKAKLLENGIGYIYVPGFTSTNDSVSKLFTDTIQNLIRKIDIQNKIRGWIVDLRENQGGNMYPMIAGLGPLIGNGTLGYFIKNDQGLSISNRWYYEDGIAGTGKNLNLTKKNDPYLIKNPMQKIAVLIGAKTSSSGEMTAISFIGKKNVKLFGQHSGGYTTGNVSFRLSDGSALVLACSLVADRNKKQYLKGIDPDVLVADLKKVNDDVLGAAKRWINE